MRENRLHRVNIPMLVWKLLDDKEKVLLGITRQPAEGACVPAERKVAARSAG